MITTQTAADPKATQMFKVVPAYYEEHDGELAAIRITNRRGRSWISKRLIESHLVYERIDRLSAFLEDGGKLKIENWKESRNG